VQKVEELFVLLNCCCVSFFNINCGLSESFHAGIMALLRHAGYFMVDALRQLRRWWLTGNRRCWFFFRGEDG
jgi:hypothetical protein